MSLKLDIKPFSFRLVKAIKTSQGNLKQKKGWLLRIENSLGICGWGEVSPFNNTEINQCEAILANLHKTTSRQELENGIKFWPGSLAFGIGAALAEIDGLIESKGKKVWLKAPPSSILLPQSQSLLDSIDLLIKKQKLEKNPLEKIETFAGPPRKCPSKAKAKLIKNGPPPVNCRDTPKIKNPKTSCTNTRIGIPNKLSSPKI